MILKETDFAIPKSGSFATLDDSMIIHNGLYVYGHALVIDDFAKTLVFVGSNKDIYSHEEEILQFLESNVGEEKVYACTHYRLYQSIQEMISNEINRTNIKKHSKIVRDSFYRSDKYARLACYDKKKSLQ